MQCLNSVNVTYRGKASHASAAPWDGVNALDAAVMAYSGVSVLRQQFRPKWRVHGQFLSPSTPVVGDVTNGPCK